MTVSSNACVGGDCVSIYVNDVCLYLLFVVGTSVWQYSSHLSLLNTSTLKKICLHTSDLSASSGSSFTIGLHFVQ